MPLEDFTTYDEVDPNSHLYVTTHHLDFRGYRNEDCHLSKDFGSEHFGDFKHFIDYKPYNHGYTNGGWAVPWLLSDWIDDYKGLIDAVRDFIAVRIYFYTNWTLYLSENYNGTHYDSAYLYLTQGTQYYLAIEKTGTSLTLKVYLSAEDRLNDANIWATRSLTLHADHKFSKIMTANTYNDGTDTNKWADVDIDNLDLAPTILVYKKLVMLIAPGVGRVMMDDLAKGDLVIVI